MRTAEEYYKDYCLSHLSNKNAFIETINEARSEAIKECSDKIIIDGNPEIAKQKILLLINELK